MYLISWHLLRYIGISMQLFWVCALILVSLTRVSPGVLHGQRPSLLSTAFTPYVAVSVLSGTYKQRGATPENNSYILRGGEVFPIADHRRPAFPPTNISASSGLYSSEVTT